ncbi:MAG: squalene--hopene cyclase [Hyphomicrobiales bacterium]|nr:squalene--hopene cyclase [Hyphomicrobiales bacterium]
MNVAYPRFAFTGEAAVEGARLDAAIAHATLSLLDAQKDDGHFVFELEADATIPAEYVLMRHFRGEADDRELERKIGVYLRRIQGEHGGWPLFHDGAFDISASVKAYFALKMIGDDVNAPHMSRAREAILAHGGASRANVFTRILLALYQQMPWRGVPVTPVEIMLLPKWFPFHLDKVSYWARTVMVPLFVLMALRPAPVNARGVGVRELFVTPPEQERDWPQGAHTKEPWGTIFGALDRVLQAAQPWFPKALRAKAIKRAEAFTIERLNGVDGLGAIFPAMVNSVLMFDALGYSPEDQRVKTARESIERLLVVKQSEAYCQPCVSPVWDTALAAHALLEVGGAQAERSAQSALEWLKPLQILDVKGDWAAQKPDVRPGGWAFQYANAHYPDVDDTSVVVMAMDRAGGDYAHAIERGREWIEGLQSKNGGWGAFDADNDHHYLNNIPFADHGALLDPPTEDVSARCVSMLAQLGETADSNVALKRGLDYLRATQLPDGSWYGRWGMNYIYGTWSSLCALNAAGVAPEDDSMRRAADWLVSIQNVDGGWGEAGDSYKLAYEGYEKAPSTASQTAWALLALMAAGRCDDDAVARGVAYLTAMQGADGFWDEELFTATGFPRVFYLRYHGYAKFFPLWALARYRNLRRSNSRTTAYGM